MTRSIPLRLQDTKQATVWPAALLMRRADVSFGVDKPLVINSIAPG